MEKKYLTFIQQIKDKSNLPQWFCPLFKTLLNKNITIEDWNTVIKYLQNVVSDTNTLIAYMEDLEITYPSLTPITEQEIEALE